MIWRTPGDNPEDIHHLNMQADNTCQKNKNNHLIRFPGSVAGNYDVSSRCTELLEGGTHPRRYGPSLRPVGQAHCSHCWTMLNCLANTWVKDAQQASNLILSDFFDSGCSLFWLLTSQRMICRCCVHSVLLEVYSIIVYSFQSRFQSDSCLSLRVGSPTYADPHQL